MLERRAQRITDAFKQTVAEFKDALTRHQHPLTLGQPQRGNPVGKARALHPGRDTSIPQFVRVGPVQLAQPVERPQFQVQRAELPIAERVPLLAQRAEDEPVLRVIVGPTLRDPRKCVLAQLVGHRAAYVSACGRWRRSQRGGDGATTRPVAMQYERLPAAFSQ